MYIFPVRCEEAELVNIHRKETENEYAFDDYEDETKNDK